MTIRKFRDMKTYSAAVNSIERVGLVPEVQHALMAWIKAKLGPVAPGVLIGGLALSFYARPRYTTDVDLLFLSVASAPDKVVGFKHHRVGAYQDNKTHVEIEITTPASFENLPVGIARQVLESTVIHGGIRVASREGLIALKLCGAEVAKRELKDLADVVSLLDGHEDISMQGWLLSKSQIANLALCKSKLK